LEVLLNGAPFGKQTVGERRVVLAVITWIKGAAYAEDDEVHVHLDLHLHASTELALGDRVVIRAS
jgi:hypothetical protein